MSCRFIYTRTCSSNLNQNLLLALSVPPGTISAYGGIVAPTGWLICDGSALSSSQYPSLYGAISNYWGSGYMFQGNVWAQGTNNFNLPDLRGLFLRGVLGTRTNFVSIGQVPDPDSSSRTNNVPGGNTGGNVGSVQTDQFRAHVHPATIGGGYVENGVGDGLGTGGNAGGVAANTGSAGGSETRPANAYVNYIIKY